MVTLRSYLGNTYMKSSFFLIWEFKLTFNMKLTMRFYSTIHMGDSLNKTMGLDN